jgi:hypothetical protein
MRLHHKLHAVSASFTPKHGGWERRGCFGWMFDPLCGHIKCTRIRDIQKIAHDYGQFSVYLISYPCG